MLSRDKRIKVLDLGLARFKDSDSTATRSGLVGTPDYMSPEQCSDALEADARSDIYSLGCTFFFICTGRHVFANRANVFQKIYAHVHEPPPSIRQLRPDASSRLDAIYRKMVAKKPEDRFASMAEVIHALKSLKRGTPRHRQQAAASSRASRRRSSSLSSTAGRSLTAANAGAADSIATLRLASGPPLAPELTNDLGMRLVWLPGGDFHLGSPDSDPNANADEKPRRLIRVPGFFLADRQVTQGQYRALAGRNPSHFQKSDDHPVDKVSWFEAVRFCNALSHREGLPPFYAIGSGGSRAQVEILGGEGYRLPSEIEWEYACRAGSSTIYPFGDDPDPERLAECAVFGRKIDDGHDPVGGRAANAFGLADMLGNVWEWCWDWHDDHAYQCDPLSAWGPPQGAARVLRGGCYYDAARTVRPAARLKFDPEQRGWLGRDVGFRAARSLAGM